MTAIIGRVLNRQFRVDNFVARGSVGAVYRVWDLERQVYLAMKVLHPDLIGDAKIVQSFRDEAQVLQSLAHEGIVPFYGFFQEGQLIYQVTAFIEGGTLKDSLQSGAKAISPTECLQILAMICPALNYAHNLGVIHCDVKPGNILVARAGKVYLTDFSIANVAWGQRAEKSGAGTPAYMAPEQILGQSISRQTDIYALGVVLFEMLSGGSRPFDGSRAPGASKKARVQWEHLTQAPPRLREYLPQVSQALEAIISRCLEKEPTRRFATTLELLDAFAYAIGADNPIHNQAGVSVNQPDKPELTSDPFDEKLPQERNSRRLRSKLVGVFGIGLVIMILVFALALSGGSSSNPGNAGVIPGIGLPAPTLGLKQNTARAAQPTITRKLATASITTRILTATAALPQKYTVTPMLPLVYTQQPKSWRLNTCMRNQFDSANYVDECVTSLSIEPDGRLKVGFRWQARLSAGNTVVVEADAQGNMYLLDDLGRRYNHQLSGGAAIQKLNLTNGVTAEGWYLFPAIAEDAMRIKFMDADNNIQTDWIDLH